MTPDEVSGADFVCKLHSFRHAVVPEGFQGQRWLQGYPKFKICPLPQGAEHTPSISLRVNGPLVGSRCLHGLASHFQFVIDFEIDFKIVDLGPDFLGNHPNPPSRPQPPPRGLGGWGGFHGGIEAKSGPGFTILRSILKSTSN